MAEKYLILITGQLSLALNVEVQDADSPATPTNLAATAQSTSSILITWTAADALQDGFVLQSAPGSGGSFTDLATLDANTTSYLNTGLSAAETRRYQVKATNAQTGDSGYTEPVSGTTQALVVPGAPQNVDATAISSSQIRVTWSEGTPNNETSYRVERSPNGTTGWETITSLVQDTTTFDNTALPADTTFYYRVYGVNAAGDSAASNVDSATTLSAGVSQQIDNTWLTDNAAFFGGPPYVLGIPFNNAGRSYTVPSNRTYQLAVDVTTPTDNAFKQSAFIFGAAGSTSSPFVLDLNGHTISYANYPKITIPNEDFANAINPATDWDLTGAPEAVRVATPAEGAPMNDTGFVLEVQNFVGTRFFESAPVTFPVAGREYYFTIGILGSSTVTLSVIDDATDTALPTSAAGVAPAVGFQCRDASDAIATRGITTQRIWVPTADQLTVRFRITMTVSVLDTMQFFRARTGLSRDWGVVCSASSAGFVPQQLKNGLINTYRSQGRNFVLKNGSLVAGDSEAYRSNCCHCAGGITTARFENMDFDLGNNTDTEGLDLSNAGTLSVASAIVVTGCTFDADPDMMMTNRQLVRSMVKCWNPAGNVLIEGNTFTNYVMYGVTVKTNPVTTSIRITDNTFNLNGIYTDSYAISSTSLRNAEIDNNDISPIRGRGILLDSGDSHDIRIHHNYIEAYDGKVIEYALATYTPTALRIRDFGTPHYNIEIDNNEIFAWTDDNGGKQAFGIRINQATTSQLNVNCNLRIHDNTIKALVFGSSDALARRAACLSGDEIWAGTFITSENDILETNSHAFWPCAGDGNGPVNDWIITNPTVIKSTEVGLNPNTPFEIVCVGFYRLQTHRCQIFGLTHTILGVNTPWDMATYPPTNPVGSSTYLNTVQQYDGNSTNPFTNPAIPAPPPYLDFEAGSVVTVHVTNASGGAAISGATVTILDSTSAIVATGTTDASGNFEANVVAARWVQTSTNPATPIQGPTLKTPHTVQVSKTGFNNNSGGVTLVNANVITPAPTVNIQLTATP